MTVLSTKPGRSLFGKGGINECSAAEKLPDFKLSEESPGAYGLRRVIGLDRQEGIMLSKYVLYNISMLVASGVLAVLGWKIGSALSKAKAKKNQ